MGDLEVALPINSQLFELQNFPCARHNSRYEFRVEDFTAGIISGQPARRRLSLGGEWDARVRQLVGEFGAEHSPELIEEMIVTALRMSREKMNVADLKLISRSMKEMRYAAKIFANYQAFRKVGIFGSARVAQDSPEAKVAEEFCRQMVAQDFMIITGGGDGIMGAAQRGAGRDMSPRALPWRPRHARRIIRSPHSHANRESSDHSRSHARQNGW